MEHSQISNFLPAKKSKASGVYPPRSGPTYCQQSWCQQCVAVEEEAKGTTTSPFLEQCIRPPGMDHGKGSGSSGWVPSPFPNAVDVQQLSHSPVAVPSASSPAPMLSEPSLQRPYQQEGQGTVWPYRGDP